jgi:hypothetical protein
MRTLLALSGLLLLATAAVAADPVKPDAKKADAGPLFNGKDLSGWIIHPKKGDDEVLEGKTEAAKGRFKVADGVIVVDAKVKGDITMSTVKEIAGDAHISFEFLPGPGCNNDLFFHGTKFDLKKQDIKSLKEGEWNKFEMIRSGKQVEFRCNGESIKKLTAKTDSSPLGLRAEAGPIQYRNLAVAFEK